MLYADAMMLSLFAAISFSSMLFTPLPFIFASHYADAFAFAIAAIFLILRFFDAAAAAYYAYAFAIRLRCRRFDIAAISFMLRALFAMLFSLHVISPYYADITYVYRPPIRLLLLPPCRYADAMVTILLLFFTLSLFFAI